MYDTEAMLIGELVTIVAGGYSGDVIRGQSKIARITAKCVTLEDGSKWIARNGNAWGSGGNMWARSDYIRKADPDDMLKAARRHRRMAVRSFDWGHASDDVIAKVYEVINV